MKTATQIRDHRDRIAHALRALYSMPSNSLSVNIDRDLARLNADEAEANMAESNIDGFRLVQGN